MSHIKCPECGSLDHYVGYGLALGGIGSYTLCLGCDAILESSQDDDDLNATDHDEQEST